MKPDDRITLAIALVVASHVPSLSTSDRRTLPCAMAGTETGAVGRRASRLVLSSMEAVQLCSSAAALSGSAETSPSRDTSAGSQRGSSVWRNAGSAHTESMGERDVENALLQCAAHSAVDAAGVLMMLRSHLSHRRSSVATPESTAVAGARVCCQVAARAAADRPALALQALSVICQAAIVAGGSWSSGDSGSIDRQSSGESAMDGGTGWVGLGDDVRDEGDA